MRRSDQFYGGVSVLAVLFGVFATLTGRLALGLPCLIIGLLLLWTVWSNRNWK